MQTIALLSSLSSFSSFLSDNAEVDVATLASSPIRPSDVGNEEGQGGALVYHLIGSIHIILPL